MNDVDSTSPLAIAQAHRTLEDVLFFCTAVAGAQLEKVVVQDEYTHDVVVRVREGQWLVYDTT